MGTWGHGEKGGKSQAQDYDWSRDAAGASTVREEHREGVGPGGGRGLLVSGGRQGHSVALGRVCRCGSEVKGAI